MAKIIEMTNVELKDALDYMVGVPKNDPNYSGWNFDPEDYKSKLKELTNELKTRSSVDKLKAELFKEIHNNDSYSCKLEILNGAFLKATNDRNYRNESMILDMLNQLKKWG